LLSTLRPPRPPLFPYTTLFRSLPAANGATGPGRSGRICGPLNSALGLERPTPRRQCLRGRYIRNAPMSLVIDANAEPIPGYRLIERIGSGGFGEVWKAEAPGGLLKAIKIIHGDLRSIDADGSRHAEQELRALKRLQAIRHPYLLSLERYDVVEGRLLIVTELADCNLWDRFREMRAQHKPGIPRAELLNYMEE